LVGRLDPTVRKYRRVIGRIGAGIALAVVLGFVTVFFAWPVGAMLLRGITNDAGALDLSTFGEVLTTGRTWAIAGHTPTMAALGTAGTVVFGIPAAYILYRTGFPSRRIPRSVALGPIGLPTGAAGGGVGPAPAAD